LSARIVEFVYIQVSVIDVAQVSGQPSLKLPTKHSGSEKLAKPRTTLKKIPVKLCHPALRIFQADPPHQPFGEPHITGS
jgi:hypothetical protein